MHNTSQDEMRREQMERDAQCMQDTMRRETDAERGTALGGYYEEGARTKMCIAHAI